MSHQDGRKEEFGASRERHSRLMDALRSYGPAPYSLMPVPSGFRLDGPSGPRHLRRFEFGPREACFVYEAVEHLREHGLDESPRIYLTRDGQPYLNLDDDLFYLQDWYDLSRPDVSEAGTLQAAALLMARLHRAGEGFEPPHELEGVRDEYGVWLDKAVERLREIYSFLELAADGVEESSFDRRYVKAAPAFLRQAEESVRRLAELPLGEIAEREREARAICHRRFTPRQLALDNRARLRLQDFDHCALGLRLDDLAKFIRRAAGPDIERAEFVLQCYARAAGRRFEPEELRLLAAYLLFPTDYWAVGQSRFKKDRRRQRTLRRLVRDVEAWTRFAEDLAEVRVPFVPEFLVPEPGGLTPATIPGGRTLVVPPGPLLPATPLPVPDAPSVSPLGLVRLDDVEVGGPAPEALPAAMPEPATPEPARTVPAGRPGAGRQMPAATRSGTLVWGRWPAPRARG